MSKEAISELCMKLYLLGFIEKKPFPGSAYKSVYELTLGGHVLKVYIPLDTNLKDYGCRAAFWHKKDGLLQAPGKHVNSHRSNMTPILEFIEKYLKKYG